MSFDNKVSWRVCNGGFCDGVDGGTIISPNYPLDYPSRTTVNYTLETIQGSNIELTFTRFDLEKSFNDGECQYDNVT